LRAAGGLGAAGACATLICGGTIASFVVAVVVDTASGSSFVTTAQF